jgi:hypothetical protein
MPRPRCGSRPRADGVGLGRAHEKHHRLGPTESVVVGPHGGDLDTPTAVDAFHRSVEDIPSIAMARGWKFLAADFHPDYASTRFAQTRSEPVRYVQHHHAHFAACLAEHGVDGPALGIVWDGSGWGPTEPSGAANSFWGVSPRFGGSPIFERFPSRGAKPRCAIRGEAPWGFFMNCGEIRPLTMVSFVKAGFPKKNGPSLAGALKRNVACVKNVQRRSAF